MCIRDSVTTIVHPPVLSVGIADNGSPAGTFEQGATGKTATITVSDGSSASGAGNTSSAVTVTFTLSSATAIVPQSIAPPGSGWACQAAVSYTHLDVYKRQPEDTAVVLVQLT